jgi:hypothetical protein
VDVVGSHSRKTEASGYLGQHIVAGIVFGHAVMPELDMESSGKHLPQPGCCRHGSGEIAGLGRPRHRSLMTAGEGNEPSPAGCFRQIVVVVGGTVLGAAVLSFRHETADGRIPRRIRSQHHEMIGGWQVYRLLAVHATDPPPARSRLRIVVSAAPRRGSAFPG